LLGVAAAERDLFEYMYHTVDPKSSDVRNFPYIMYNLIFGPIIGIIYDNSDQLHEIFGIRLLIIVLKKWIHKPTIKYELFSYLLNREINAILYSRFKLLNIYFLN